MAGQGVLLQQALLNVQQTCSAAELREVLDVETLDILQRGCSASLGLLDVEGLGPSTIDAVCATSGRCIALIGEADVMTPAANVIREALAAVAALLPPGRASAQNDELGAHFTTELAASKALQMLEEVSDHLDYLAVTIFGSLFREQRAKEEGYPDVDQTSTQCQALQGVAVWTLTVLARAVGYDCFNGIVLWEWASGDPFCILVLTKGLLSFGLSSASAQDIWLQAGLNGAIMPEDIAALQDVVFDAVLQLAAPDIVFQQGGEMSNNVGIADRNESLSLHRALLAVAIADTGFVDVIVSCLESSLTSDRTPRNAPRPLAVVAFLAALVQRPVESLPPSLGGFVDALAYQLSLRAELWPLLLRSFDAVVVSARSDLRGAYIRSLIKDLAILAYAIPPEPNTCWEFFRICLSEQSSNISVDVRSSAKTLASLVVFAANSSFQPGNDHLAGTLLTGIADGKRAEVASALGNWRAPVRAEHLAPWTTLLGSTELQEALASDDDDDFFEVSRREARAAAHARMLSGPPAPKPPPASSAPSDLPSLAASQLPPVERSPALAKAGLRDLMCSVPAEIACGVDGRLVVDPVRSPYGQVFERSVLQRALVASGGMCPITRQPLSMDQCPRDAATRKQALAWVRANRERQPQA